LKDERNPLFRWALKMGQGLFPGNVTRALKQPRNLEGARVKKITFISIGLINYGGGIRRDGTWESV